MKPTSWEKQQHHLSPSRRLVALLSWRINVSLPLLLFCKYSTPEKRRLSFDIRAVRNVRGRFPIPVSALYGTAAVLTPCIVPFTFIVMGPGIRSIQAKAKATPDAPSDVETKALLQKWSEQNVVRASLVGGATLLGVLGLLA
jgi:hypothetical protein